MKRKVYRLKSGSIKNLTISEEEIVGPKSDEVVVKTRSIGLNFADIFAILGLYSATPKEAFIPGLEYSGIVSETGTSVTKYTVGDKVMGITRFGAYTSHITTHQDLIIPIPNDWTYEEGAGYLVQVLTAYYGLIKLGDLQKGDTVLIHSAAGGVGIWANRIVKHFNGYTIGTVSSTSKLPLLAAEGYDDHIIRNPKTFKKDLQGKLNSKKRTIEGRNADELNVVMECIGGRVLKGGYDMMSAMGRMIVYGSARYGRVGDKPFLPFLIWKFISRPKIDPQQMTSDNKSVMAFNLIYLFDHVNIMYEILENLKTMHLGKPIIGHRYDFKSLPDAIRMFQTGKTTGKIVVNIGHE